MEYRGIKVSEEDAMLKRKKWTTPQLVRLVRGKPEEAVLGACKSAFVVNAALGSTGSACNWINLRTCGLCSRVAPS